MARRNCATESRVGVCDAIDQIYDTTLRDGSQGEGVNFSLLDKLQITQRLAQTGVEYIEGDIRSRTRRTWSTSARSTSCDLQHAKICAFGMTRRKGSPPAADPGMQALLNSGAPVCTIVGKTSDFHATRSPARHAGREPRDDPRVGGLSGQPAGK